MQFCGDGSQRGGAVEILFTAVFSASIIKFCMMLSACSLDCLESSISSPSLQAVGQIQKLFFISYKTNSTTTITRLVKPSSSSSFSHTCVIELLKKILSSFSVTSTHRMSLSNHKQNLSSCVFRA